MKQETRPIDERSFVGPMQRFGAYIRGIRTALFLDVESFAAKSGLMDWEVFAIERGDWHVDRMILERLAVGLQMPVGSVAAIMAQCWVESYPIAA